VVSTWSPITILLILIFFFAIMSQLFEDISLLVPEGTRLKEPGEWTRWYSAIRHAASVLFVWNAINRDEEDIVSEAEMLGIPEPPSLSRFRKDLAPQRHAAFQAKREAWMERGGSFADMPIELPPKNEEVRAGYLAATQERLKTANPTTEMSVRTLYQRHRLIFATVDTELLHLAMTWMTTEGQSGTRGLLRALRDFHDSSVGGRGRKRTRK
jgi:hypothetical protein